MWYVIGKAPQNYCKGLTLSRQQQLKNVSKTIIPRYAPISGNAQHYTRYTHTVLTPTEIIRYKANH